METKSVISQRSCSAVQTRTLSKNLKNCFTKSSINLPCIMITATGINCLEDSSVKWVNKNSNSSSSPVQDLNIDKNHAQDEAIFLKCEKNCFYPEYIKSEDLEDYYIQKLKCKLEELNSEFIKENNIGQILKRDILVAKKVVKTEIAVKTEDFRTLLEKANNRSWKGRQEIILALKRKLRHLNEIADPLKDGSKRIWAKNKTKRKSKELINVTDDHKIHWYLELERREVFKNANRYRQKFVTSRDLMKRNLERVTNRNEKLMIEIRTLQKKLCVIPKGNDEELLKILQDVKNQQKIRLEEKADERRKIDILEQEICRHTKLKEELKTDLAIGRRVLGEMEEKIKSLKEETVKLQVMSEIIMKRKLEQAAILEDVEHHYQKIVVQSESVLKQLIDSKHILEKRKSVQLQKSSISSIRKSYTTKNIKEQLGYLQDEFDNSQLWEKVPSYWTYKNKLIMYQSIFKVMDGRNEDKMRNLLVLINETKNCSFILLQNRYLICNITHSIKTLKSQNKRLKKNTLSSTKQKPTKKSSSQQMMEVLNERKVYLAIKKTENKCLKSLIKHVLANKVSDYDILNSHLTRNKDIFLKELTYVKL